MWLGFDRPVQDKSYLRDKHASLELRGSQERFNNCKAPTSKVHTGALQRKSQAQSQADARAVRAAPRFAFFGTQTKTLGFERPIREV